MTDTVKCLPCGDQIDVDLAETHEQNRLCPHCKTPWVPDWYEGRMRVDGMMVTPDMARRWLEPIPDTAGHWFLGPFDRYAKRYAALIKAGKWQPDGDVDHAITFDAHGYLLIGVIRMVACVDAGRPFDCIVRTFDPVVPGHVPFGGFSHRRKTPALLHHWTRIRENLCLQS